VVGTANENLTATQLLEVALHAQIGITNRKQLGIDRAMGGVTNGAALARGFVLEYVGTALLGMTAEAALVFGEQGRTSTFID
jgi:hypothetical protein